MSILEKYLCVPITYILQTKKMHFLQQWKLFESNS